MEQIKKAQKRYCSAAILAAVAIGGILIGLEFRPLGKGLILGTLFSVVNFILMGQSLPGRTFANGKRAMTGKSLMSILFRYALLAVPLYIGLQYNNYEFFAVMAGLFAVQIMILGDYLLVRPLSGLTRKRV